MTVGIGRLVAWLALVGGLAALAYYGRATAGKPDRDILYQYSSAAGAAIQYGLILAVLLWIAAGLPKRELFALRRPRSWKRAAQLGAGVLVGVYVVAAILEPILKGGEEQGLTPDGWDPDRAGAYAANFVAVAIVAPIVEELAYRGIGYTLVERFLGQGWAIGVTALLFGLAHGLLAALPLLVLFGLGLAYLRARTGSLYPCIVIHALFNAVALIAAVLV